VRHDHRGLKTASCSTFTSTTITGRAESAASYVTHAMMLLAFSKILLKMPIQPLHISKNSIEATRGLRQVRSTQDTRGRR